MWVVIWTAMCRSVVSIDCENVERRISPSSDTVQALCVQ